MLAGLVVVAAAFATAEALARTTSAAQCPGYTPVSQTFNRNDATKSIVNVTDPTAYDYNTTLITYVNLCTPGVNQTREISFVVSQTTHARLRRLLTCLCARPQNLNDCRPITTRYAFATDIGDWWDRSDVALVLRYDYNQAYNVGTNGTLRLSCVGGIPEDFAFAVYSVHYVRQRIKAFAMMCAH
jgi:hypothetical protein